VYCIVGLAIKMVELACILVEDPWQKKLTPEKVMLGVSYTKIVYVRGALVPLPLVAVQLSV
jgi:hypothetical protein